MCSPSIRRATAAPGAALLLLLSGCQASVAMDEPSEMTVREEVLAVNERLAAAARTGDVSTLAELLSEDLVVSDPSNTIRAREDLLELFATRQVVYRSVETTIDHAEESGGLFVIMGTESTVVDAVPEGVPWKPGTTLNRRYTNVYRREGAEWRLIIKQSTVFSIEEPEEEPPS